MSNVGLEQEDDYRAREAERCRRTLAKQRQQDARHLKQLRRDIAEDREHYKATREPARSIGAVEPAAEQRVVASHARLLVRASNGASLTCEFESSAPFSEVRALVESTFTMSKGSEITVAMPRRELDRSMDHATLDELGLAPSATLLVRVPEKLSLNPAATNPSGRTRTYISVFLLLAAIVVALLAWYVAQMPPILTQEYI